jgi:alkylated DNA repair protein (DNA oxidative demethylase)
MEGLMLVPPEGFRHIPGYLDRSAQERLVAIVRTIVEEAPLYTPAMPKSGQPMSVRMTNCGVLGWVSDKERGYRYQPDHPVTGKPWPRMPEELLAVWEAVSGVVVRPEACLINYYGPEARMGLHQDRDEAAYSVPVVSISLGDACLFRIGGTDRSHKTLSLRLESGDIVVLGGESRLCFHGVDRIYPLTSTLLKKPGRINLTLRRVNPV